MWRGVCCPCAGAGAVTGSRVAEDAPGVQAGGAWPGEFAYRWRAGRLRAMIAVCCL